MDKKKDLTPAQTEAAQCLKSLYEAKKKRLGITQQSIADELDITQGAVGHYLNGRNALNPAVAAVFARMLQVSVEDFSPALAENLASMGVSSAYQSVASYKVNRLPGKTYPLITSVQAGAYCDAIEFYCADEIETWMDSDAEILGEAFWWKMEGDAMTAPTDRSIPNGSYVLFDTGREPVNSSLVMVRLPGSSEATFRKLVVDGGQQYLAALNPQWPLVPIDDRCRFIAVAIQTRCNLL